MQSPLTADGISQPKDCHRLAAQVLTCRQEARTRLSMYQQAFAASYRHIFTTQAGQHVHSIQLCLNITRQPCMPHL